MLTDAFSEVTAINVTIVKITSQLVVTLDGSVRCEIKKK